MGISVSCQYGLVSLSVRLTSSLVTCMALAIVVMACSRVILALGPNFPFLK
ncbi:MAG: hypothetical protein GX052_08730 [Syntrophomonadaceae bacterium]|nr:hypothetical protein [Syntrophomonadaceae bacterium]